MPLEAPCPACGTANEPDDRDCGACGSPMDGPPALRLEPAAERRMVSVLFTDLVGFTTRVRDLGSEAGLELTAAGRHADAEPVMDEARQIYTELAMAPALERVGGGEALPRGA